jgi:hypothetical protein
VPEENAQDTSFTLFRLQRRREEELEEEEKRREGKQTQLLLLLSVADLSSVCAAVAALGFEFSVSWSPKISYCSWSIRSILGMMVEVCMPFRSASSFSPVRAGLRLFLAFCILEMTFSLLIV